MRHYVFDESDIVKFKYCPHCGEELYSVYQGDYAGYLECSECDGCEGFYILEEMIFREPKWLINVIKAYISEMNNHKHDQNKHYREAISNIIKLWDNATESTDDRQLTYLMYEQALKALEGEE